MDIVISRFYCMYFHRRGGAASPPKVLSSRRLVEGAPWPGQSSSRANDPTPIGQCGVAGCARTFPKPSVSSAVKSPDLGHSWDSVESQVEVQTTVQYCTACPRGSMDLLPLSDGGRGRTEYRFCRTSVEGHGNNNNGTGVGQLKCSSVAWCFSYMH
jgi:hypothetical protein